MGLATPHNFLIHALIMASPMGLALFSNLKVASPMGLATPHNFLIQPVSTRFDNGQSQGTCHFYKTKVASPMGLTLF